MSDNVTSFRCNFVNMASLSSLKLFSTHNDMICSLYDCILFPRNKTSPHICYDLLFTEIYFTQEGPSIALGDVYWITMTNEHGTCHICQTNEQAICILSDLVAFVWMEYTDMYLMVE